MSVSQLITKINERPPKYRKKMMLCCGLLRLVWDELSDVYRYAVEFCELRADREYTTNAELQRIQSLCHEHAILQKEDMSHKSNSPIARACVHLLMNSELFHPSETHFTVAVIECVAQSLDENEHEKILRVADDVINPVYLYGRYALAHYPGVKALAKTMYEKRSFELMPMLSEVLQDADCEDVRVLAHCNSPDHVRGCWLLDELLAFGLMEIEEN